MTNKTQFSYCLLQYEHDPWLKERLNIGVLMLCEARGFVELKTRGWEGRLFRAYPNLARPDFTEDLKQMRRSIVRFGRKEFLSPTLFTEELNATLSSKRTNKALNVAHLLLPDYDSSYRWISGGVGLCDDPRAKLDSLFDRFVAPFDKQKPSPNRSDDQVWSSVSKAISNLELDQYLESEPTVRTDLGKIKFQAGYQNGAFHLIQPLSFDLADEDNVSAKAAKWSGYAMSIMDRGKHDYVPHFVLGSPTRPSLSASFHQSKRYLENLVGASNVILEEESDGFAQVMATQIRDH